MAEDNSAGILEKAKFLWEEYRYRHELCWKLIFQTTAAVVIILVIPFTKTDIVKTINYWILAMPFIAIVFLLLIYKCLLKELFLLQKVRNKHREMQTMLYNIQHDVHTDSFTKNVKFYLLALGLLCITEVIIIIFIWIPFLA